MSQPTDRELIDRWKSEQAPLLPLLHAFHDRDGFLSDDALRVVAEGLRIPIADLFRPRPTSPTASVDASDPPFRFVSLSRRI